MSKQTNRSHVDLLSSRAKGRKSPQIGLVLSDEVLEAAKEAAYELRQPLSKYVRQALLSRLLEEGRIPPVEPEV